MSSHFDAAAWGRLTIFEQMGNIGSEVGRALNAKHSGDNAAMKSAFYRGIDLLNATAEYWSRRQPGRAKEILIAKDIFATSILTDQEDPNLEQYFMDFALTARMNR